MTFVPVVRSNYAESSVYAANLVAQALGGNDGDLITHSLVGLEVESKLGVVPLNDDLGGLLDCLRSNATHFGEFGCWLSEMLMSSKRVVLEMFAKESWTTNGTLVGRSRVFGVRRNMIGVRELDPQIVAALDIQ
jgi:hypothetical protein